MDKKKTDLLRENVQMVISYVGQQKYEEALLQHSHTCEILDEILDYTVKDDDVIEISRYQVLLNQLQLKIQTAMGHVPPTP